MAGNQFVRKADYPESSQEELADEQVIMSAGGSVIIFLMGEILAGPVWDKEELLVAELDFSELAKSKLDFDVIGHYARDDVFKLDVINQPPTRTL